MSEARKFFRVRWWSYTSFTSLAFIDPSIGRTNIVHRTEYELEDFGGFMNYRLKIDWATIPGYICYDYDSDTFLQIIRHPMKRDDCKAYEANPLLANHPFVPRQPLWD